MHISKSPKTSRDHVSEYIKNIGRKNYQRGATHRPRGWGRAPCLVGPLTLHRPQLQLHIFTFGEKKIKEKVSLHFTTRSRRQALISLGRADLESVRGFGEGGFVAVVIINHPPSPISWCSPPCVSNSIVGLLDGYGLDEIYHLIELVLLGFDP